MAGEELRGSSGGEALAIGLDLGAATVKVAVATGLQANLLAWPEGPVCPAALSLSSGTVLFGKSALERVGTHWSDTVVEPLSLAGGPGAVLEGRAQSAEQLISWWLERAIALVQRGYPAAEPRLVACVPWEGKQVTHPAMVSAASRSGVQLLTTVQSTTAAALGHASITGQRESTLLVVDVAAHRLEAAIIRMQAGKLSVAARACEKMGGGSLDDALAESCLRELFPGLDMRRLDPTRRALIQLECERVRKLLGEQPRATLRVQLTSGAGPDSGPAMEVTRRRLEDLTKPLREAIAGAVRRALVEANLKPQELHDVIAVGGVSHMPLVGAAIRDATGRTPAGTDIDGAAARGAAIIAAKLSATTRSNSQPPLRDSHPATTTRDPARPSGPAPSPSSPPVRPPPSSPPAKPSPSAPPVKDSPTQPAMRSVSPTYVRAPISPTGETMPAMQAQSMPQDPVEVRTAPSVRVAEAIIPSRRRVPQPYSTVSGSTRPSRPAPSQEPATTPARPWFIKPSEPAPSSGGKANESQRPDEPPRAAPGPPAHPTLKSPVMADPNAPPAESSPQDRANADEGRQAMVPPARPSVEMVLGAARASIPPVIQESEAPPAPSAPAAVTPRSPAGIAEPTAPDSAPPSVEPAPRATVPVPGARGSLPPGVVVPMQGSFVVPRNAADLVKLPLRRALTSQDLDPIWLPVLLISLAKRKDIVGTMHVQGAAGSIVARIANGGALLEPLKPKDPLLAAFKWEKGTYKVQVDGSKTSTERPESFSKTAVEGIRDVLRQDTEASIEAALGEKLKSSPKVTARGLGLAEAVGFWTAEKRFLKYQCDGSLTGLEAMKCSGISRFTALQVLFVIDLFGELTWGAPHRKAGPTVAELVASRVKEASHANHFELLGLHWSALEEEIERAYQRMVAEYGPSSEAFREAPDAARTLLEAAKQARAVLAERGSRMAYLQKVKPDLDFLALKELLRTRSEALDLKGQQSEARATDRIRAGVDPLARRASSPSIDLSKLKKD
ncbi:MAG: Hsp70 family protein [Deltaproteobacteria bacterium]|nr:Hsp70 family protein [Deltaproteobacteria bacterium]